jgi:DNA polymerase IV
LAGRTVTLKLKTTDFKSRTRATALDDPTQLAHRIFDAAKPLLMKEATGTKFRLLGVSISSLVESHGESELTLDAKEAAHTKAERAMDKLREKFGADAVERGLALRSKDR